MWALFAVVALAVFITYWRIPPEDLHHTSGTGPEAGASRVVVFLGYPLAIAAIPLAAIAAARLGTRGAWLAMACATVLCATIGVPGVIDQGDLDARPSQRPRGGRRGIVLGLSRCRDSWPRGALRSALGAYLARRFVYGLAKALQDFWTEQLVKRGTLDAVIPSLIRPAASWSWAAMIVVALAICLVALRVVRVDPRQGGGTT